MRKQSCLGSEGPCSELGPGTLSAGSGQTEGSVTGVDAPPLLPRWAGPGCQARPPASWPPPRHPPRPPSGLPFPHESAKTETWRVGGLGGGLCVWLWCWLPEHLTHAGLHGPDTQEQKAFIKGRLGTLN